MTSHPMKPGNLDAHCEGDLVVARITGTYDADVARYLESLFVEQARRFGYRLGLFHARDTTMITPEARRLMSEWDAASRAPAAGAVIGASFTAKTLVGLLGRAVLLINSKAPQMNFFDTERDARMWLDAQRIRFSELRNADIKV